jgi:formylmethanofuran dehydrogenase subunit E
MEASNEMKEMQAEYERQERLRQKLWELAPLLVKTIARPTVACEICGEDVSDDRVALRVYGQRTCRGCFSTMNQPRQRWYIRLARWLLR